MITIDWDVITSVSTATAAILALTGLAITIGVTRHQLNQNRNQFKMEFDQREASNIRASIYEFASVANRVSIGIGDDGPILSAAWIAAGKMFELVSNNAENGGFPERFRALVSNSQHYFAFLYVRAYEESPSASDLYRDAVTLSYLGSAMNGELRMVANIGAILSSMALDLRTVLIRKWIEDESAIRNLIVSYLQQQDNPVDLRIELAKGLKDAVTRYKTYNQPYREAAEILSELTQLFIASCDWLAATELVSASKTDIDIKEDNTGGLPAALNARIHALSRRVRALSDLFGKRLEDSAAQRMTQLVARLEEQIRRLDTNGSAKYYSRSLQVE